MFPPSKPAVLWHPLVRSAVVLGAIAIGAAGCGQRGTSVAETPAAVDSSGAALNLVPATADSILRLAEGTQSGAMLVNVWATWCTPCREEFPDLMEIERRYRDRGLKLVLVSADFEDQLPAARRFLAGQGVDFTTYIKVGDDMKFIDQLSPKWTGALPATFLYDAGGLRYFHEGRITPDVLDAKVRESLDRGRS